MPEPFRHSAIPPFDHSARPSSLGFTMPPEWAPHRATWLSWPHRESSWPGKFEPVPHVFAEMVRLLSPHEEVHINVTDEGMEDAVQEILIEHGIEASVLGRAAEPASRDRATLGSAQARPGSEGVLQGRAVYYHHNPTNDAWCRDHGPCFIQRAANGRREEAIVDWGYNAWGG